MKVSAYIICATPRSGSTLLCDLLSQTGVAGRPESFYRQQSMGHYVEDFGIAPGEGPEFQRRYLAAVIKAGTGDTGLFGMRVMWPSMPELLEQLVALFRDETTDAGRLAAAFGAPLYIHCNAGTCCASHLARQGGTVGAVASTC